MTTEPKLDIGLTDKQLESVRESTAAYNIWEGAVSSGKTVGSLYRWIMFVLNTMDLGGELVMTGRTRDSVWRNNVLPMMEQYPGVVLGNLGAPTCRIAGRVVHIVGASDIKAEAVIRGMTILGAYADEVTTLPKEYFQMLLSRLRVTGRKGGLASKLFATTNPDQPRHWFKVDYLDNPRASAEWRRFHFTINDNPRLSKEYIRKLDSQYTGVWHDRFIKGLWVAAEGAIWGSFDRSKHVVDTDLMPPMERVLGVGIDYGTESCRVAIFDLATKDDDGNDASRRPDPEFITDEDVVDLQTMVANAGADLAKFLTFLKVPSLADLPANKLDYAKQALKAKQKEAAK